jgi:hypothetical protein
VSFAVNYMSTSCTSSFLTSYRYKDDYKLMVCILNGGLQVICKAWSCVICFGIVGYCYFAFLSSYLSSNIGSQVKS